MKKRLTIVFAALTAGVFAAIAFSSLLVHRAARGRLFDSVDAIPHRRVGLVLGCGKEVVKGKPNLYFRHRVAAAAKLFESGKVDFLLVSGDNRFKGYDEASDMKQALLKRDVPEDRLFCDFAGLRTLDSVVRSRTVFGQDSITVVSQPFHNRRAIFIAGHRGVDAIGFNAANVTSAVGARTMIREQFARVKTVLDIFVLRTEPRFGGPPVLIGAAPAASAN